MRITFCVVSWTVFVRVVFTDLVQTQQTRDVPAVTLLQHEESSDSRGDGHVHHSRHHCFRPKRGGGKGT